MSDIIHDYDAKMQKTVDVVVSDFASVRAGRANAGVLDRIAVEYYGILDIVVGSLHEIIESAMNLIILSRLDLNRKNGQTIVVVNEEIHLPALLIVVIVSSHPCAWSSCATTDS